MHGEQQLVERDDDEEEEEAPVIPMEKHLELPERLSTIYEAPSPPPSSIDAQEEKLVVYDLADSPPPPPSSHIQTMKLIHSLSSSMSDFISPISLSKHRQHSRMS